MGTNKGVGRFQTLNHILRVYIFDKIQKQFWYFNRFGDIFNFKIRNIAKNRL